MIKLTKRQQSLVRQGALHLSVVALLCLWFLSINRTSDQFLTSVEVNLDEIEGERDLISKGDIKKLILKELPNDVMSQTITRVDIGMIEHLLRADTRVYNAEVFIDAHQKLIVDVVQRRPILRVMNYKNDQYYIDQAGDYITKVEDKATRVPVATGYVESYAKDKKIDKLPRLNQAFGIIKEIRKDKVLKALIEQVHFEKEGKIILIPKIGDQKIILEHVDKLESKLDNLKTFYRQLARTNGWKKYDEINISYDKQVVLPPKSNKNTNP